MNLNRLVKILNSVPLLKTEQVIEHSAVKLFNRGGNRLASKQLITGQKALKKISAPYLTHSADIVKIEKEFGQKTTEIISFRDKNNKLISRYRRELEQGKEIWHSNTEVLIDRSCPKNKNYSISLVDKQSTKYNPINEAIEFNRHSTDYVFFPDRKTVSQLKYKGIPKKDGGINEVFSITDKVDGKVKSFITGTAKRTSDGRQASLSTKTSQDIPQNLLEDPYLVLRTMPSKISVDFLKELFCKKMKLNPQKINLFHIEGADKTFINGMAYTDQNKLGISVFNNLGENINTMAHELRHFKQEEFSQKFWHLLKNKIKHPESVNNREFKLSKLFKIKSTFTNPFINRTSFKEKDAWKIGDRFQKEYIEKTKDLKEIFPYFSKQTMGINKLF